MKLINSSGTNRSNKKFGWPLVVVSVVVLAALAFFAQQYFTVVHPIMPTDNLSANTVIKKVGKLMVMPTGTPTVTTVSKVDDLKTQAFFANVQQGDKVLIFVDARKIVVYRPSSNQIVNAGPILNDSATTAAPAATTKK